MYYNFNLTTKCAAGTDVGIDTDANYGFWEHKDGSEGGGLWFENNNNGKLELVDFDGAGTLPGRIVHALLNIGVIVDSDFE